MRLIREVEAIILAPAILLLLLFVIYSQDSLHYEIENPHNFNSKRAQWARPLFALTATAVLVLSLSATGPRCCAGKCGESVASINDNH
jgi:hypothetical protein